MFYVRASAMSLLQAVAVRCHLPFVSLLHEVSGDDVFLYGVEVELSALFAGNVPRQLFF